MIPPPAPPDLCLPTTTQSARLRPRQSKSFVPHQLKPFLASTSSPAFAPPPHFTHNPRPPSSPTLPMPNNPQQPHTPPPPPPSPSAPMIQHLPEDVQTTLLSLLPQSDLSHLAASCTTFYTLASPLLFRQFRCVSCRTALFHPRELSLRDHPLRHRKANFGPSSRLPRRAFFELRPDPPAPPSARGMVLDARRGAANFHVLRHLAQTVYRNERYPLPRELQAVRALRCANCAVFVGFRLDDPAQAAPPRDFVHHDFVELVDAEGTVVTLAGEVLPEPEGTVRCVSAGCRRVLFQRDDMLPWTHVLASSRLEDMDAYLEWEHSWAGSATQKQPAFFVKRLAKGAGVMRNVRPERLRQGHMEVGDMHCAGCDAQIGWKFVAELPEEGSELLHNYDQVGRYGIIRNSVLPAEPRLI